MIELFWVLFGFALAIIWERYKDWQRYRTTIKWLLDELKEIKESLELKFDGLPLELKQKVKIAQEEGTSDVNVSDLAQLPIFEMKMPHRTSAWQTFIANGYANKLKQEDYELMADAYNTLEGSNFIRGLSPTLLVGSSSPFFDDETKKYFLQQLRIAPLYPVIFALPKIRIAYDLLERNVKSSWLSSLIIYVSK